MSSDILKYENTVFDIIQEYLYKNRVFDIDKILPIVLDRFAKANINVNQDGIRRILISLIEKSFIAEGSTLVKTEVLLNLKRRQIYALVTNKPGMHFNKIAKESTFYNSVVAWHLKMLIKFNFIKKDIFKNREIYFPAEMTLESAKRICVSSREKCQKILYYLKSNDIGLTKTQLSDALQMHPNTLTKYIEELQDFNLISKDTIGNRELYFLEDN